MSERNDYIKAISKVGRALGTTIERDKLLEMIVKSAVDTMDGKAACLFLATEKRRSTWPWPRRGSPKATSTPRQAG